MSVTVLEQDEDLPDSYPVPSWPIRPAIPDQVWQRIESYIAWRSPSAPWFGSLKGAANSGRR